MIELIESELAAAEGGLCFDVTNTLDDRINKFHPAGSLTDALDDIFFYDRDQAERML